MQRPPAGWVVPSHVCFVATVQRSGSNLLGSVMAQAGGLGRPGEFFNRNVVGDFAPPRSASVAERCAYALEHGTSDNGVLAVKLFPGHMSRVTRSIRISSWFGTPRWVWLRRRDQVAQAVSWARALQSRAYTSGIPNLREPVYDASQIMDRLRAVIEGESRWQAYFSRTGVEPLSLFYEDVVASPAASIALIANDLGVTLEPLAIDPGADFQPQRSEASAEWVTRFRAELGDPDHFDAVKMRLREGPIAPVRRWLKRALS